MDAAAYARAAFAVLAGGLLALVGHCLACDLALRSRRVWWLTSRYERLADGLRIAGCALIAASVLLLGLAAMGPRA